MTATAEMVRLIERKKRGESMTAEELQRVCDGAVSGAIPDYQLAAWLMAVCWRGMSEVETQALTRAMVVSGATLDWGEGPPVVDKHSTGGVGDKTSLVLVPLLAAAGLRFVKMSGRGLGHTGGTIDKMEAIPGLRTRLDLDELRSQVNAIGCALVAQSAELVPADAALYALRDATATIDSEPLIASSVMSKKLAAGAQAIVLDVKFGSGAFMQDEAEAEALARAMIQIGAAAGRRVGGVLSPMGEPLGRAVGNALEVAEAIEVVQGGGPADLRDLVLRLGSELMRLAGVAADASDARPALERLLSNGAAAEKLEHLVAAQGGDPTVVSDSSLLPRAPRMRIVESPRAGWIAGLDAREVAEAALALGAGRRRKGADVDPRTGVIVLAHVGDRVEAGEPLAELHAASEEDEAKAEALYLRAFRWSDAEVVRSGAGVRVLVG